MKRLSTILTSLMCLLSFEAGAQWYMFDLNEGKKEQEETKKEIIAKPYDGTVNLALVLPMQTKKAQPSENFLDMYCGALMAVRDIADRNGIEIRLKVVDSTDPATPVSEGVINGNDVVIGPVSLRDVETAATLCYDGSVIVSPLDPKTIDLADSGKVIQSPASWQSMIDEMILWLREETTPADNVIVLLDPSAEGRGEQSEYLTSALRLSGVHYRTAGTLEEIEFTKNGEYKLLIASDSDKYITPLLKQIAALATRLPNVSLFCTSRVRSSSGMNLNDLYYANARLTAPYHIDYNAGNVKDFVLSYRALFNTEPSSFSFQGYDAVRYYVGAYTRFGSEWPERLSEFSEKGLQSDFRFNPGKKVNTAARRVIYNRNLTTTLQQ